MSISLRSSGQRSTLATLVISLATALSFYSCGGSDLQCGGPFCVSPGPPEATKLTRGSGNGQTGSPGRELPLPLEVIVTNDDDQPIQDVVVTFTVGEGSGNLSDSEIRSDVQGRAQVNWTLGAQTGPQSVQAAANTTSGSPLKNSPVTFSAEAVRPPAARLVLRQAPSNAARNGIPFEQQPIVEALDADNQPVQQVPIVASIASGGGTLSGTKSVSSDAAGRATYTDLAIVGTKGPRTIRFSVADPALEVVSGSIIVGAGAPAQLAGIPPLAYEGTVSSPVSPAPSVVVKDAAGNGVPGVAVTFEVNRDASVSPETATTDEGGVAQVTSWTLGTSASAQYTLTARVEGSALTPIRFSATARAGAAGRLTIATQPSSPTQNGTPFAQQPVIQVVDLDGNPAPQPNVPITATVSSGPSLTGALQNASATTDASGRATFTGLTLIGPVGNYTVSFSAPDLTGVTSNPISLTVGLPAQLALAVPPSPTARSRVPLAPQPTIQVQDVGGNPIAQPGIQVAASIGTGEGTLAGETAVTDGTGRAAFASLTITGSPGPKALSFSSPGLQGVSAQVTLPSVSSIEIRPPAPSPTVVAGSVSTPPSWILRDAADQPIADAPVVLSASTGGSVVPTSAASDVNGIVQVQSWTLGTTAGDQYVEVSVPVTGPSSQVHIVAIPDAATQLLKISGDNPPQSAPVNSNLPDPFVVRVVDQYGNGVSGVTVLWRACDGSGDYNPTTDVQGFSSASQPTGPQSGTFCTQASGSRTNGSPLDGSPVQFTYTVQTPAMSPSQLSGDEGSVLKPNGPAPVAPRHPSVIRPSPR